MMKRSTGVACLAAAAAAPCLHDACMHAPAALLRAATVGWLASQRFRCSI